MRAHECVVCATEVCKLPGKYLSPLFFSGTHKIVGGKTIFNYYKIISRLNKPNICIPNVLLFKAQKSS